MRQQQSTSDSVARTPKGKFTAKTESKEMVKENLDRIELLVTNEGSNKVYLAAGATAVAKEGPFLAENGAWSTTSYTGPVSAITASGESALTYLEI